MGFTHHLLDYTTQENQIGAYQSENLRMDSLYQAPLYNRYTFGNYYSLNNSLFDKVFKNNYWSVEKDIFLPELLGVEKEKVIETLNLLKSGNFPIELSSKSKESLILSSV